MAKPPLAHKTKTLNRHHENNKPRVSLTRGVSRSVADWKAPGVSPFETLLPGTCWFESNRCDRMNIKPRHVPDLALKEVTTAVSYYFKPKTRDFGWAICTVNDQTGELAITSDWGNWSYRWDPSPRCLGAPTLTHFIGERGGCDYLADKLWGNGYGGQRFSPCKTVAAFRRRICELRLEQGRQQNRYGLDSCLVRREPWYPVGEGDPLTEGIARELWESLDEIEDVNSEELFLERLYRKRGVAWLGEELWNDLESETSPMYEVLLLGILPALRDACAERVRQAA